MNIAALGSSNQGSPSFLSARPSSMMALEPHMNATRLRPLTATLVLSLATFGAGAARGQVFVSDPVLAAACLEACVQVACQMPTQPSDRILAVEILGVGESMASPPAPLGELTAQQRAGVEGRLFLGLGDSGYELFLHGGYLAGGPSGLGTLRSGLGLSLSYGMSPAQFYLMGAFGIWINGNGGNDSWGPGGQQELRLAAGMRVELTPVNDAIFEIGLSTLFIDNIQGATMLGLRVGGSFDLVRIESGPARRPPGRSQPAPRGGGPLPPRPRPRAE